MVHSLADSAGAPAEPPSHRSRLPQQPTGPDGWSTAATGHRAVQQNRSSTGMDWPAPAEPAGSQFSGTVFVVGPDGAHLADCAWSEPSDEAADSVLELAGWQRTGAWSVDVTGRRVAPVAPVPTAAGAGAPAPSPMGAAPSSPPELAPWW